MRKAEKHFRNGADLAPVSVFLNQLIRSGFLLPCLVNKKRSGRLYHVL
jgi:hypothetical protein